MFKPINEQRINNKINKLKIQAVIKSQQNQENNKKKQKI